MGWLVRCDVIVVFIGVVFWGGCFWWVRGLFLCCWWLINGLVMFGGISYELLCFYDFVYVDVVWFVDYCVGGGLVMVVGGCLYCGGCVGLLCLIVFVLGVLCVGEGDIDVVEG